MRQFFRSFIVLLLIVWILGWTINTYAKNSSNGKNIVLSEKYNSKQADRIKNSINQKNNYRFLINSTDSFQEVTSYFESIDKKIKIKEYSNGNYMIKLPKNTNLINTNDIDSGLLPTVIWKYNIVQPEIVEWFGYLDWEETTKLLWNTKIWADIFQEELSLKEKIKVAILDTWINYNHTDLDNNYNSSLSYNFINEISDSLDDNWHGTQVAWIIWAEVNWEWRYWVNSNSDLVSLKVLDIDGLGTSYDILEAIDYAKQNWIKVLNMSFGWIWDPSTSVICEAITDAKINWIYTIASAGNSNMELTNIIPASCSDTISVWSINQDNTKADFSNYWDLVDIYAPWVDIYTTTLNNTYTYQNWTSFSAPYIVWIISKELVYNPNISYDELISNLHSNYNLITNLDLQVEISTEADTSTGTTSTWTIITPTIDYSNYSYYSWTFLHNWELYWNSLYSNNIDFLQDDLSEVEVFTYDEYITLNQKNDWIFKTLSVWEDWLVWSWELNWDTNDDSWNNNNATAYNISWIDSWRSDWEQVWSFNGTSSYINTISDYPNTFSSFLWYKSSSWVWTFLSKLWDTTWYVSFTFEDGRIAMYDWSYIWLNYPTTLPKDGNWHHIWFTFSNNTINVYLDWVLHASWPFRFFNSSKIIQLGHYGNWYFTWSMSDLKMYNKALSLQEIQNLYSYWTINPIDDNTSTNTIDSTTNYVLSNTTVTYDSTDNACYINESNKNVYKVDSTESKQAKDTDNEWDPVTLSKWEFTYDNTLMSIPWIKIPYTFDILYKNQTYYNWPVWVKWDHNYNMFLQEETNWNVVFYNWKLWVFRFIDNWTTFDYNEWLRATLVDTAWVYTIEFDNGDIYTFNSTNLKISKLEDRYWNDLNFTYTNDLLTKVTDTLNRDITYTYYSHNRIQKVTDFNGRKVELNYYDWTTSSWSIYDLESVVINNWTWATKSISFEYDSSNNITKLIDSKDQTYVTNTYDSWERVSTQEFGSGTISYTYTLDTNDNITKNTIIDKLGNKTEYNYDSSHNNTSTVYYNEAQTGSVTYSYIYDTDWYITKETKPRWNGIAYTYDTKWNLTEKRVKTDILSTNSSNDLVTSYTYNSLNQVLTTTHPNWVVETNTIDSNWNITSKTVSNLETYTWATYSITSNYTYLSNWLIDIALDWEWNKTDFNYGLGQVTQILKWSWSLAYTWSFSYNDYGNIISLTDWEWNTKTFNLTDFNLVWTGTTAEWIVTSYIYDENNNKVQEARYLTGWLELNSYFYYDVLDNMIGSLIETSSWATLLTSYKYDENDNLIEKRIWSWAIYKYDYNEFWLVETETIVMDESDSSKDIVTTYSYDSNNNLVSKTDALWNETTYTYDLYDRLTKETNPEWTYVSYTYNKDWTIDTKSVYDSSNNILSKTEYAYDWLGNIVKETSYSDATNSTWAISKSIVYDNNGKVVKQIDWKWNETINVYDNLWRLDYTLDSLWNKVDYSYDNRDLTTSKSIILNTGTWIVTTSYNYDDDGRLVSETDNLNNTKTYIYNNLNHITSKIDWENNAIDYSYDYLWNVLSETSYLSGSTITKSYEYDNKSNLTKVIDWEGNETIYEYDTINRNTKVTYADNLELVYTYDKNSNLKTQTDPNWTITINTYDSLNRLTARSIQTWTWVIWVTSEAYIYDDLGRVISWMDDNNHDVDFVYDDLGRLTTETQSWTIVNYEYDDNNNLTKITHPDSRETTYTYDNLNRNTTISFSWETIATYSYTWVVNDSISYWNGKTISKTYDEILRLASLNNWVKNYSYTYDNANNIISDSFKDYTYDEIYRVTGATDTNSWTILELFNYDDAWNRNNDLSNEYTSNILNQYTTLSWSTNTSYVYDNNWNITNNWEYEFEYDYKNRLLKVSTWSTTIAEFNYDVLGRRIEKTTSDETTTYIYSDKNALEENKTNVLWTFKKIYINWVELDNLVAYKVEEPDLSIAERDELEFCELRIIPYESDFNTYSWASLTTRCNDLSASWSVIVENTYYFHKNHLGSIVWITDESWNTVSEYDYDVFGKATLTSWDDIWNTRLYTWREFDEEILLYYLRARYYDAELGRFISRDPIGQVDDVNLYAYVGNNSVMFVDLNWLASKWILNKTISWLTAWWTFIWMWIAWIVNEDIYYGSSFLWNSIIWATELKYYDWSDYVKILKQTNDYKSLVNSIKKEIWNWNIDYQSSNSSSEPFTILTLWKYDYSINADKIEDWYNVKIKITDIYDFNKEDRNTLMWKYLNLMHDANESGFLTPINVEININEIIKIWKN